MTQNTRPTIAREVAWLRGGRARFEGGAIVLERSTAREYSVLTHGGSAAWELGAVRRPQDAVDFARRFGLLQHGHPDRDEDLSEPWSYWESTALHIHSILVTATMLSRSRRGDDTEAIDYIARVTSAPAWRESWQAVAATQEERRIQLGVWIAREVSAGLAGMEWGIETQARFRVDGADPGPPERFVYEPRPRDLLGWVYYGLAQTFVEGRPSRICDGCGITFLVNDQRQRYHDKRCAQRVRYHRSAEKRRQEA